ncbi:MAG TPA: hypothetical protein PKE31_18550 [Pseudomonadota bacterium]|nr:hypothetical protein [Pseudomonadota bacterium]
MSRARGAACAATKASACPGGTARRRVGTVYERGQQEPDMCRLDDRQAAQLRWELATILAEEA